MFRLDVGNILWNVVNPMEHCYGFEYFFVVASRILARSILHGVLCMGNCMFEPRIILFLSNAMGLCMVGVPLL